MFSLRFCLPTSAEWPLLLGGFFLAFATASWFWAFDRYGATDGLWHLYLWAGLFLVGAALSDLRAVYIGAAIGMTVNSAFVTAQWLGWHGLPEAISPAGLFINKNLVAEAAVLAFAGILGRGRLNIALMVLLLPAMLLPMCREAFAALIIIGTIFLWRYSRMWSLIGLNLAVFVLIGVVLGSPVHGSVDERLDIWTDTITNLTWLGHGVGSFYMMFPWHAVHNDILAVRPDNAHNDYLELLFDFGIGGVPLVVLVAGCLRGPITPPRLVLAAFLTEACFGFPFFVPLSGALAAISVGHLSRDWGFLRRRVPYRRVALHSGVEENRFSASGPCGKGVSAGATISGRQSRHTGDGGGGCRDYHARDTIGARK